jgi:uncharacterized membrane protein
VALVSFAAAEEISSFAADIRVGPAGELTIVETIDYDFGAAERRGIYRTLRSSHPQAASAWYKTRYLDYEVVSASLNGESVPYRVSGSDDITIRIGDPDRSVTGAQRYTIEYIVTGAIATYDSGTEVYWNVTGDEWEVPINTVSVAVRGEEDVRLRSEQACYVGVRGSSERCTATMTDETATFSHAALKPGEGVTIAQRVSLSESTVIVERINRVVLWLIVSMVWLIGLVVWLWRWRFAHRYSAPIITQYEPYGDFKPMFTGVLFDKQLDSRDITAGIIYLAEQGFLSITQTNKKVLFLFETNDYELTLKRPVKEVETEFQRTLLSLFDLTTVGQTVSLGDIKKDQSQLRRNAKIRTKLAAAVKQDLYTYRFIEQNERQAQIIGSFILLVVVFVGLVVFSDRYFSEYLFALVSLGGVSLLAWMIFGLERRTRTGYQALYHIKGFMDFLRTTEKDRYAFHNAPDRNPETFMRFLPYAVAFGVESEWAEVFADIQIPPPDWYASTNVAAFSATSFTNDIGSFSTAFAAATTVSSSGSGGGGFSGGGAGGGGGGSW